jgi:hypothetical protein
MRDTRCKCGQQVVWAHSVHGKAMPINWPPRRLEQDTDALRGKFILVWSWSEVGPENPIAVAVTAVTGSRLPPATALFESHFATCPYGDEFRRHRVVPPTGEAVP